MASLISHVRTTVLSRRPKCQNISKQMSTFSSPTFCALPITKDYFLTGFCLLMWFLDRTGSVVTAANLYECDLPLLLCLFCTSSKTHMDLGHAWLVLRGHRWGFTSRLVSKMVGTADQAEQPRSPFSRVFG